MTLWNAQERTLGFVAGDVNAETLRIMLGLDVARDGSDDPVYGVQVAGRLLRRPVAPRKRRGLTGKRYRIARRRYARLLRAWKRGEGTTVQVHYYLPRARLAAAPGGGIRGMSAMLTILDEAMPDEPIPFVLPDHRDRTTP